MRDKSRFCILRNERDDDHILWIKACKDFSDVISYKVVNLTSHDWFEQIAPEEYDYFLAKPPGLTAPFKQLYDERIYLIDTILKLPIYPTPIEIYIYENKRMLYSWLKANNLPHPDTFIFYSKSDAFAFLKQTRFPIVAKSNIGASGSGVKILHDEFVARKYIDRSFSDKGAEKRWGPNFSKGEKFKRALYYINHTSEINKKLKIYQYVKNDVQKGFVILQSFIPHDFEWRIVAIGDSYFAHKKLKIGEKASGSTLKNYDNPPLKLFDFAKTIMERFGLTSQAIDVFESKEGDLYINEMQCIFGQSDAYQMMVNGKPGRYKFLSKRGWIFEQGYFNTNESFNLRLRHVLDLLTTQKSSSENLNI